MLFRLLLIVPGTETVNSPSSITLTDRNLFKISITEGQVEFWINGNQVATHTTNLPDILPYLMFYNGSEAAGSFYIRFRILPCLLPRI